MTRNLYAEIGVYFGEREPDRRGWTHVNCPFCGAEADSHHPNFSFGEKGFKCFKCQAGGGLKNLAEKLGLWTLDRRNRPEIPVAAQKPRSEAPRKPSATWKANAVAIIEGYKRHPQRVSLWQDYKPIDKATIEKHDFGIGRLPDQKALRLIVPLYWQGEVVGLKGRYIGKPPNDNIPSWVAAETSIVTTLWGFDHVPAHAPAICICENYVDAAIITQEHGMPCLATGGARIITDQEVAALRNIAPRCIILAYDNDLAGQAEPLLRAELERKWIEEQHTKHPGMKNVSPPQSAAYPTQEKIRQAGLRCDLFPWPSNAPAKADLMWALTQQAV